jgi:Uma2 family endonuclease
MEVRPVPAAYRLTVADWLAMPERRGLTEILQGDLLVRPSPTATHQLVVGNLYMALRQHLGERGWVFLAPLGVRFSEDTVLEPDLFVVLAEHAERLHEEYVEAPPDLVVEVLSRGSARRDLHNKRAVYAAAGVAEYWIVDPQARALEVLVFQHGSYSTHGSYGADDVLGSKLLPQLAVALSAVFARR